MSLQFNDTTTRKGIIQHIEKECGFNYGDISGNTELLKDFTADVNLALDDYIELAIKSSGSWQFDDSGHEDYPEITTDIVSGQRDYSFIADEQGNLILDIYKVFAKDEQGTYREITPVDKQDGGFSTIGFNDGLNTTGVPDRYDKTANGILLDLIPSYNSEDGLKVLINREGSYFVYTDTTKKPGVPGIHHEYFALKPSLRYARINLTSQRISELEKAVIDFEGSERLRLVGKIREYFGQRQKDVTPVLSMEKNVCE